MQKLTPLQKRIQERYADDEPTKNKMLSSLFQAANVNPLAGCAPALIQIPIFISLYRALQNLIAENKLDEPFLWIPGESNRTKLRHWRFSIYFEKIFTFVMVGNSCSLYCLIRVICVGVLKGFLCMNKYFWHHICGNQILHPPLD